MTEDQVVDAAMAQALQVDATRATAMVTWLVMQDPPDYPGKVVARLVTAAPTPYVLVAETLGELHAALPPGLTRSARQPADLAEVVEMWFT